MIITLFAIIIWLLLSLSAAVVYLVVIAAATLILSWFTAFSSAGVASGRSKQEQREMFERLLGAAVLGSPWWPLHLIGLVAAAVAFFL